MTKFVELPLKTPFLVNVNNINFVKKDGSGVSIQFTGGASMYFEIAYDEVIKLLVTTD